MRVKRSSAKLVLFIVAIFILYSGIKLLNPKVQTQIAVQGTMEKAYSLEGIVMRNEYVLEGGEDGIFEAKVKEHEVVKKNKHIATIYDGAFDKETGMKLEEINRRINELSAQVATAVHSNDAQRLEDTITSKINDIIIASNSKDARRVSDLKENLTALALKRFAITTSNGDTSSILTDLKNQKAAYEKSFDAAKTDLFSPNHGVFSTSVDGLEQSVSYDKVTTMTVSDYQVMKKAKPEPKGKCKVIDSYQWSVATLVNDSTASELEKGKKVYLRFKNENIDIPAHISYISQEESNKYVVVITSYANDEYIMTNRHVEFELVYEKYSGIKIPVKTINVTADGVTGVYVLENSTVKFKQADVVYKDSKNAIIKTNNSKSNYLLLYDEIITKAPDYTEGKKYN